MGWVQDTMKIDFGAHQNKIQDLASALRMQRGSKAIAATCIPVHMLCCFERMASGNEPVSGPIQFFAGIVVLCGLA